MPMGTKYANPAGQWNLYWASTIVLSDISGSQIAKTSSWTSLKERQYGPMVKEINAKNKTTTNYDQ